MALGIGDLGFSAVYLIGVAIIVLYIISKILRKYSNVNFSNLFRGKGEEEVEVKEEQAEHALAAQEHVLMNEEAKTTNQKFELIRRNLDIIQKAAPESKAELVQIIGQIISLIDQEINLFKQHMDDAQSEIATIVKEIEDSQRIVDEQKLKLYKAANDIEKVKINKAISDQKDLQSKSNTKLVQAKQQIDLLSKISSILSTKKKWFGKTQLKQAKEEEKILSKGNEFKDLLKIAQYLFQSETEIMNISRNLQGDRLALDATEAKTQEEARLAEQDLKEEAV